MAPASLPASPNNSAARALAWLAPQLHTPLLTVVMLLNFALQVAVLLPMFLLRYFPMADVDVYALAAQHVRLHQPLYPLMPYGDLRAADGSYLPFLYPPPYAAAVAPLGALPRYLIVRILYFVTFLAFWAYAATLGRLATGRWTERGMFGAGLILTCVPGAYFNLIAGQAEPLLWLGFSLALLTPARGALLAASCLVKPFAAWPLALAVVREPRRVLPQAVVTLLLGLVIGGLVCGWGSYHEWLAYTPDRMYRVIFYYRNISLSLLPLRALGWQSLPTWGRLFLWGMYVLGPGLLGWVNRKRPLPLQLAWVGAAAILFAPFSRDYYLPLLLVPLALELRPYVDGLWGNTVDG
jgi:hypothetical protein